LLKNLLHSTWATLALLFSLSSCATSVKWEGDLSDHKKSYLEAFTKFRGKVCGPKTEATFEQYLKEYRGQGYWIPEFHDDVDVESIKSLLPEMEKKLSWIKGELEKVKKGTLPKESASTKELRSLLAQLLTLKKTEYLTDEAKKMSARKESLKLLEKLTQEYKKLITTKVSFFSNYSFPVDHLKNRKVYDEYREKEDDNSVRIANYTFLYRKLLEDGAYNKDHTGSDIYLRTTLDTLFFELNEHDFYLTEDARFDLEFVLAKIESELSKGRPKLVERLTEWSERTQRTYEFYKSLTLPEHFATNKELIKEHNQATEKLKKFVYTKQAEVFDYWLGQPELMKAIFVLETILLNEVGGVDGDDALERMDVARVVANRLDKPKYLRIGKKEFIYPYLKEEVSADVLKKETWLNALFKQGEFSFTYYYMAGVPKIFCPDLAPSAKRLRERNVEISLQVLKEEPTSFKVTRYISRASMIGRIHMDSVWEDYVPYPERPGLLASGQESLTKKVKEGHYTYLYSFKDPAFVLFQVLEIDGKNYVVGETKGIRIFYYHRNPHYFKYFTKTDLP
jgi:hypothetical protein